MASFRVRSKETEERVAVRKYVVYGTVQVGVFTYVEAESPEEAKEIAEDLGVASTIDHANARRPGELSKLAEELWVMGDDIDEGEPTVEDVEVREDQEVRKR